jgi:hypothetical protein
VGSNANTGINAAIEVVDGRHRPPITAEQLNGLAAAITIDHLNDACITTAPTEFWKGRGLQLTCIRVIAAVARSVTSSSEPLHFGPLSAKHAEAPIRNPGSANRSP